MAIYMWREYTPVAFTTTISKVGAYDSSTMVRQGARIRVTLNKNVDILGVSIVVTSSTSGYPTLYVYNNTTSTVIYNDTVTSSTLSVPISLISGNSYTIYMYYSSSGSANRRYTSGTVSTTGVADLSEYLTITSEELGRDLTSLTLSMQG